MEEKKRLKWETQGAWKRFHCAHCGSITGSAEGYQARVGPHPSNTNSSIYRYIYICQNCHAPTYFDEDEKQHPAPSFGDTLTSLPEDILQLYDEARRCMSVNAFTAASLCCRKLLMNVAVNQGALENQSYAAYVDYLLAKHIITPLMESWVDRIREIGNDATHEIRICKRPDAENAIRFSEMLLRVVFEYPALAQDSESR